MDQCLRVAWFPGMDAIAKQSNFLFSPMSLRAALALLASGTHGATLRQLLAFLGSRDTHLLATASARLLADVASWPQLTFAAAIFADRTLRLTPEFASSAASSAHRAVARSVDFRNRPAAAVAEANAFIERATAGRLRGVLSEDAIGPTTRVVLANGLHFKAKWARRFYDTTARREFLRHDGRPVPVPFLSDPGMHYAESFDAPAPGPGVQGPPAILQDGGRDGLAGLLRLAVTRQDFIMRCVPRREQVVSPCMVPKFKFSTRMDLASTLCRLGLTAPFDKDAADLSGMVSNMPPEGLYVSGVGQSCAVEVDEEGTEAAAATYTACSPTYSPPENPPPPPMRFVADHPFMFAIVEYEKAEVLFLGHVMDPSQEN
ncbi:unnamed protein product [Urochloa decumbens]|uniref:Serpin domain-containing protein n=1 Tax=Urochloa decumbens TaxID=240449 RepID=A0ABC9D4G2_9POAL